VRKLATGLYLLSLFSCSLVLMFPVLLTFILHHIKLDTSEIVYSWLSLNWSEYLEYVKTEHQNHVTRLYRLGSGRCFLLTALPWSGY
jgi:hypothetical protein